jgi:hypothetical protein
MARLIDDMRAGAIQTPWFIQYRDEWKRTANFLGTLLMDPELPVILIDNVADYYYTGSDQEQWNIARDFPNIAPPFPRFWMEHRMPKTIHSKECGDSYVGDIVQHGRVGFLIHGLDPAMVTGEDIPPNTKWILWLELFIDYGMRNRPIEGPHGSIFMCVDANGALIGMPQMKSLTGPENSDMMKDFITWAHPILLAMTFLHCKDVTMADNDVPKPLAKKYAARHGGLRPVRYKTLIIEPLKATLRTQGKSGSVGLAKALHICRGHFRDYREGRGLFGKYKQLVWTPMGLRGGKEKGEKAPAREMEIKV